MQAQRTILIVDGSATSAFYVASMLRKLRYAVKTTTSAEDALSQIARSAPTAVITDTVLPRMSGFELLAQLKKSESLRFIPVIINTAEDTAATRDACRKAGCTDYFIKPVENEVLYRAIQAASEATPRRHIRIPASIETSLELGASTVPEEAISLSEGGLFVKTAAPAPKDALVPLTLNLSGRRIKATAVVLYSSDKPGREHKVPGMGMRFTDIGEADVAAIREYVRQAVMKDLKTNGS